MQWEPPANIFLRDRTLYTKGMTTPIQTLPLDVIHRMAAGEVIDSLAAAVRELAENAIDAQATRIHIGLWPECWRVRVTDNGLGMTQADLAQATRPHCTSKIQQAADLWQITSLGFRGEALHSLTQVADLEICSRVEGDAGYRVSYSLEGVPVQLEPLAMAPGTIVTADQVFANWPSRRETLPMAVQLRAVQQVIQHLALCHPYITWQVEQQERPWFAIAASTSAKLILTQCLREVQPSDLQEGQWLLERQHLEAEPQQLLTLLLGLPDRCHRRRPDWIKIAVNRRVVKLPELEQTILHTLRRTLPRERHPVCFVHLQAAPQQVDWNRHPAKQEIYLHQIERWQTQLRQAIDQMLQTSLDQPESIYATQLGTLVKVAETDGLYRTSREISVAEIGEVNSEIPEADLPLMPLKAIAQVHQRYIVAEHASGLWLVEQHIAHERVLYEQLCQRWQMVPLASPLILGQLSERQVEQLQRLQIEIEPFGEQRWVARSAPELLADRPDCSNALLELSQGGDLESALVATACRTAIRNGTPLTLSEMQTLLDQWQRTQHPRTCPHGRPIYLSLEESSLSRFFRRHWVIGKSHGI
jgi:DNA mismatch repair protein MutL